MKHLAYIALLLLITAVSCTEPVEDIITNASITLNEGQELETEVDPEGEVIHIKFTSSLEWKADVDAKTDSTDWVSFIPSSGKAGEAVCKLKVEKNNTGNKRSLIITIASHEVQRRLKLIQESLDKTSDNGNQDNNESSDSNTGESTDKDEEEKPGTDADGDSGSDTDDNTGNNTGGDTGDSSDDNTGDNNDAGNDSSNDDNPGQDVTTGPSGKYGWYELPQFAYKESGSYMIDSEDSNLYYAHHICAGGEKGPNGKTARNYTVCYSAKHHCPVWVAAPRHTMYQSGASRTDAYGKDPAIPSNIQYNSKETGGGCNKGHMLGSAERLSTSATNKQVFYYTNIAPQYSDTFNTGGGGWNILEDWVDGQVCSDTLYVVIGAYFEKYTDRRGNTGSPATISFGGRNDVTRPSMFYYILMRTKKGNSGKALKDCTASEIKCAAFVRSHETPKSTKVNEKDMMSVSDLEKLTGFTYFTNVPQAPKDSYTASDWGL